MTLNTRTIAIDVREACKTQRTGKGQWARGFVEELLHRKEHLLLLTDRDPPSHWVTADTRVEKITGSGLRWHWCAASLLRGSSDVRLFVSPTSYIVPALLGSSFPCVPVVHDLIAFRPEPHERKARFIERFTLPRAVRHAAHILTISDATKKDLLARYQTLDPASATSIFAGPMRSDVALNEPDGRTILCIATLSPRKNQERLIRAFASLPASLRLAHRLVLAGGRGWQDDGIISLAKSTPGVEWLEYVNDAEYGRLLHTCTVFALPSLYEGFGMQILDALQRGIPVLTSDRGSLAEVAGDAACVVDPGSVESIAKGLERLLSDAALRDQLRKKGPAVAARYSWGRTVELFLGAVEGLSQRSMSS